MGSTIRTGVLGTGSMARKHTANLSAQDGVEVVAVCSRRLETAQSFIAEHAPGATPFDDFSSMLGQSSLDAVCVCLPPAAHRGEIVAALDAGLHVFAEKPLALDLEAGLEMAEAARRAGTVTQVCYQFRFKPSVVRLERALADGGAGRPTLFTGRFWVNMEGPPWWRDITQSGGQVFEQLIHIYNLAKAVCGRPVRAVGMMDNLLHADQSDYTVEDTSVGLIRFEHGAMASITGSNCAVPNNFFADFRIACEQVTLDYHGTGQNWVEPEHAVWYQDGKAERIEENTDAHRAAAIDFVEAIRGGRPAKCPIGEAYDDLRLVSAVIASAGQGGQPVEVEAS